jgi:hypothetical protein
VCVGRQGGVTVAKWVRVLRGKGVRIKLAAHMASSRAQGVGQGQRNAYEVQVCGRT